MMGPGYHIHGGSSTLSPLAPPFTVAASGQKPVANPLLVDMKELNYYANINPSFQSWTSHDPQPHNSGPDCFSVPSSGVDTVPSSNAYGYSPPTTLVASPSPLVSASSDAAFFGRSAFGLAEAEPYYSSYVSPAAGDDSRLFVSQRYGYDLLSSSQVSEPSGSSRHDYAQDFSSLEHVKPWDVGSGWWEGRTDWQHSESVKLDEGYCSKGGYTNQGIGTCRDSQSTGNDYKSFCDGNLEYFPSTCSTSALPSTKVNLDTHAQPPLLKAVNSRYQKIQPLTSYDKGTRDDVNPNASKALTGSLPAVVISVPVQDSYSFKNANGGGDKDFPANSAVVRDPQPFNGSEGITCFDANQLSFFPQQSDCILEFSGLNKNPVADSLEQIFLATTQTKSSGTNPDCSNSSGCCGKAINSVENYPESSDSYNHAEDSPCWKGAPVSHWNPSQVSEFFGQQNMKKHESSNGKNDQDSPSFPFTSKDTVEVSPEKESEKSAPYFDQSLECLMGSSFENHLLLFKDGINDGMKSQHVTRPECCQGIQVSDDIHEPWKGNVLSDKSIHSCGFNLSNGEWKSLDEEKMKSDNNCAPRLGVAGDGKRISDEPDGCSSQLPFLSVEDLVCPHPSTGDALFKLAKPLEPMSKGYVHMLVNTIHNLSEVLQFHFSNDACELKEEDSDLLMKVMKNLNSCILKNMERKGSTQESFVPQCANSLEGSTELHKVVNLNGAQVLRVDAAKCADHLEYLQQVQDKEHNITHVKDEKFSNFTTSMAAADVVKDDKMTQAIKKVLAENFRDEEEKQPQVLFYKNLWLEAEASLCLSSSMARFNRMKIEMGNCHVSKANELPENTLVTENLPRSEVTSDPSPISTTEAGNKDDPVSDSPIPDSSVSATSSQADDVLARFHILKARADNLSSLDTSVAEKLSGSKLSTEGRTDKLACETLDTAAKEETPIHDIFMSGTESFLDDVEASVLARFEILRCRDDNSRPVDMETHQPGRIDNVASTGLRTVSPNNKHGSKDDIVDVNMEPGGQNSASNTNTDRSTVKEIDLVINDDPVAPPCMTYELGDHACTSQGDSASSDWEHILKEEYACKNR